MKLHKYLYPVVILLNLLLMPAFAQDDYSRAGADSAYYLVETKESVVIIGKIFARSGNFFKIKSLRGVDAEINEQLQVSRIFRLDDKTIFVLHSYNGMDYCGNILRIDSTHVVFRTLLSGTIDIPADMVKDIHIIQKENLRNGRYLFPNPHYSRYLFGVSGFTLKKGDSYWQNLYGLWNTGNFAVTDFFSVGAGMIFPFMLVVAPKISFKGSDNLHFAVGNISAISFFRSQGNYFGAGLFYGVVTYGNHENNFTIGTGYAMASFDGETITSEKPTFTASAMIRASRKISVLTENYIIPIRFNTDRPYTYMGLYGIRVLDKKLSWDIGFIQSSEIFDYSLLGIPYVGLAFRL